MLPTPTTFQTLPDQTLPENYMIRGWLLPHVDLPAALDRGRRHLGPGADDQKTALTLMDLRKSF